MEFTTTKRGARAIVYKGHKYVMNQQGRDGCNFWRSGRNCSCSGSLCTLEHEIDTHNHPPNYAEIQAEKIVSSIQAKARDTIRPIPALYHEEIQAIATQPDKEEIAAKLPTLAHLKSSLHRNRRSRLPPMPESRADVHFDGEWTKTASGEDFLMAEDGQGEDRVIMFATDVNIKLLCEAQTMLMAPSKPAQVYSTRFLPSMLSRTEGSFH